jgi:hypothetical protein
MLILKRLAAVMVLAMAMSFGAPQAFAGEMSTPGFTGDIQAPGITGDMQTPGFNGNMDTPSFTGWMGNGLAAIVALFG